MKHILTLLALGTFLAGPALAQDPLDPTIAPGTDPLDPAGGALLEGGGLVEKETPKKKVLADPDEKQRDELEEARSGLEKRVNAMQKRAGKYADSEEAMAKVTAKMLKAFEGFFPKHNKALQTYRAAVRDNKDGAKAKAGKEVGKLRTGFLKEIAKLNKELDKVEALTAKLEEKVKQEEAEDAAEGGGEE